MKTIRYNQRRKLGLYLFGGTFAFMLLAFSVGYSPILYLLAQGSEPIVYGYFAVLIYLIIPVGSLLIIVSLFMIVLPIPDSKLDSNHSMEDAK